MIRPLRMPRTRRRFCDGRHSDGVKEFTKGRARTLLGEDAVQDGENLFDVGGDAVGIEVLDNPLVGALEVAELPDVSMEIRLVLARRPRVA